MDAAPGTRIAEHGPQSYAAPCAEPKAPNAFAAAYLLLFPWTNARRHDVARFPGRDAATQAMFGHRAKIDTVRSWRKGWRNPPQWACDMLANHLRRSAAEQLRVADLLTAPATDRKDSQRS